MISSFLRLGRQKLKYFHMRYFWDIAGSISSSKVHMTYCAVKVMAKNVPRILNQFSVNQGRNDR